jgi:hypothetical protein
MTATRAALLVAVVASASTVFMALASAKTQTAQSAEWITAAGTCPAVDTQHVAQ